MGEQAQLSSGAPGVSRSGCSFGCGAAGSILAADSAKLFFGFIELAVAKESELDAVQGTEEPRAYLLSQSKRGFG